MRDAIEGMNGHSLDGRNITVNEAQSRGNGGGGGGGGGYSRGGGSKIEEDSLILTQINQSHGFCSGFRILNLMMMKSILGLSLSLFRPFTSSSFFFFFFLFFFFFFFFSLFLCVASIVVNPIKNMFSYVTYVLT
jgi:hypothetical protein